jgi:hypothetical protein
VIAENARRTAWFAVGVTVTIVGAAWPAAPQRLKGMMVP